MSKYSQSLEVIRSIRQKTDTAVIFHSIVGKDSIALLDMCYPHFKRVICVFMYLVPNLAHIGRYISWMRTRYPSVEIMQIPHIQRLVMLHNGFFCIPQPEVKPMKIGEVEERVRNITGIKFAFSGMKGVDGYMKRMRLKMYARTGYVTDKGMAYPLALWTNKEVLRYIDDKCLISPYIYEEGKVSQGLSITYGPLNTLREQEPKDFDLIMQDFPFAQKLFFDHDKAGRNAHGDAQRD